jgi:predicted Rossmann fold nucleotide-binding protein DprA/Smf involved in DNA uptake
MTVIERIISGGQTGVDRAALDVALEVGLPCGGWCPRDRRAEDGAIPFKYPLTETAARNYNARTRLNVSDADGTLIINRGVLDGGTAYTVRVAQSAGKPWLVADVDNPPAPDEIDAWLNRNAIKTLNVAGPREDKRPGIYEQAVHMLRRLLYCHGETRC